MNDIFETSVFFGAVISLLCYGLGVVLHNKTKLAVINPLLIAIIAVIAILAFGGIEYETYNSGAKYISYLLTPATVCLAVPLYEQTQLLKKNLKAVAAGIVSGVLTSLLCITVLAVILGLSHEEFVTFLPKSITTAIGMGVSEELGGFVNLTVVVIIITGILGNVIGKFVCRIFKITEPVAVGIAFGSSSHAIGTAKAMEIGEVEGAMSSLSIVVSGVLTVIGASLFSNIM
ncbi:MAG: LrgB family protein [Oscillospiraceae bacterium]|nr:LrgB family protein [Oscillospiraceae bacterium]MDY2863073.1 LrgB family protein [Oscillospiraceae bacterium]